MTVKTYHLLGTATAIAPGWFAQISDGVAPANASPTNGWKPGGAPAIGFFRSFLGGTAFSQTVQASSYIDVTTGPQKGSDAVSAGGDSWITPLPLTGTFAAGNWAFTFYIQVAGGGQNSSSGLLRCRVWASKNADGSAPRLLTTSTLVTNTLTGIGVGTIPTPFTVTWAAPAVTLDAEYLFFQMEANITAVGGTTAAWGIPNASAGRFYVVTTDFQPPPFGHAAIMIS